MKIKISIITPTFNSEKNIHNLLVSLKKQSYKNFELIIVDNFSVDSTIKIIKKYNKKFNIKIIKSKSSIYRAMNIGIKRSTGDVINFIGSDDFYLDNNIFLKIAKEFKRKKIDIIYGNSIYLKNNWISRIYISPKVDIKSFQKGVMPSHTSAFFSRNSIILNGYYDENIKISSDFDYFLRSFLNKNKFYRLKIFITCMNTGGISNRSIKNILISNYNILKSLSKNKVKVNFFGILIKLLVKLLDQLKYNFLKVRITSYKYKKN